jgi:hypothetical protein
MQKQRLSNPLGDSCALILVADARKTVFVFEYRTAPSSVIARSQRVRAKRGPMTGSATKQSRPHPRRHSGLLRFARNDEGCESAFPRHSVARVMRIS